LTRFLPHDCHDHRRDADAARSADPTLKPITKANTPLTTRDGVLPAAMHGPVEAQIPAARNQR
jgi:hypothetical protein